MRLLFITRKWDGYGGMQRLSRDLWRGIREAYGEQAMLCVSFGVRAACLGLVTVWRGGHVHLGDAALAPLGWFLKKMGRRVTVTACGLDVIWPRRWYQWMLRRTLPAMDRVVCISRATAEEVRGRGVAEEKIVMISPGVWMEGGVSVLVNIPSPGGRGLGRGDLLGQHMAERLQQEQPEPLPHTPSLRGGGRPLLVTVGRLVPRKGVAWFVRNVVPLLLRDFPQLQYWIVGIGPEEFLIKKVVQENGLEHCVHLRGELDDTKWEECFTQADLFIMPNVAVAGDMEGFGIVCIEASARGVPVVAAHIDGLSDAVVDGKTGRFFPSGNADECAKTAREILEEGRAVWHRTAVVRATLEHYGWPLLFQRYRDEVLGF